MDKIKDRISLYERKIDALTALSGLINSGKGNELISLIRNARDRDEASREMVANYDITTEQASTILTLKSILLMEPERIPGSIRWYRNRRDNLIKKSGPVF